MHAQNQYLDYQIDSHFQRASRLFILSFEDNSVGTGHTGYCFLKVEVKDYNIKIYVRNLFDQSVKNDIRTYENIRKYTSNTYYRKL